TYDTVSGISFGLILEGCKKVSYSKTWLFRGTLKAEVKNETGKVKMTFPATAVTGDTLQSEGAEATLSGEGKLEEREGGTLEFKEEKAGPPQLYKCVKVAAGTGRFTNGNCTTEGAPKEFELELLKELLKIVTKQVAPMELEGKLSGVTVEIKCEKQKGTGSVHNGEVAKDLEPEKGSKILTGLGLASSEFEACSVTKPVGQECKVKQPI